MPRYEEVTQRAGSLQALTGLTEAEFQALLPHFEQAFVTYMHDRTIDGQPRTSRRHSRHYQDLECMISHATKSSVGGADAQLRGCHHTCREPTGDDRRNRTSIPGAVVPFRGSVGGLYAGPQPLMDNPVRAAATVRMTIVPYPRWQTNYSSF